MTDLEITRLCAEAMGLNFKGDEYGQVFSMTGADSLTCLYDPLHDDAQAMALLRHMIEINDNERWEISNHVVYYQHRDFNYTQLGGFYKSEHLNRAIVECVAKMQKWRKP